MTTNTVMVIPYTFKKYGHVFHKGLDAMTDLLTNLQSVAL